MLRDIITDSLATQLDMDVVGAVDGWDHIGAAAEQTHADVVIVAQPQKNPAIDCWPLLFARPQMKVFAISGNGRSMALYELRPHEIAFGDVSARGLPDAIRTSLAGRGS